MPKFGGSGQSELFTRCDLSKLIKSYTNPRHLMMLYLALYTLERWGAIRKLKRANCYYDEACTSPRNEIIIPAQIRKGNPDGSRPVTRMVPALPQLKSQLRLYRPNPESELMFPGNSPERPISKEACYKYFRSKLEETGLDHKGYSPHGIRATGINLLHENGVSERTIMAITGHKSSAGVHPYIRPSQSIVKNALSLIAL